MDKENEMEFESGKKKSNNTDISRSINAFMDTESVSKNTANKILSDRQNKRSYWAAKDIIFDLFSLIKQMYHKKESYIGIPTGFTNLDNITSGFQNSEFIVLGARPSVGKTALALTMASNMAIKNKIPVGFFTLEMTGLALLNRFLASESNISTTNLRSGMLKPSDIHKLTEASERIYEAPLYIDDTPNLKLIDLKSQARRMHIKEGVKIIFIDYIGLIETENECKISRHEQLAIISRSLKSLARELNIPIVCLSHIVWHSKNKPPSLANLRRLSPINQDADVVIFLHRTNFHGSSNDQLKDTLKIPTDLIIAKQRNGPLGTVPVAFIPKYTRFENLSRNTSKKKYY